VNATSSVRKSLTSTGPQCQLFPTSETLTAATIVEPICSQADFHASPSLLPGSDKARQMTVSSGLRCLGLFPRQDQLGLLVKMLAESSVWRSTVCLLTWKVKGTPLKRSLYQLAPSMPRINETEFGLWHTPTATNITERTTESLQKRMEFRQSIGRKTTPPGGLAEQARYGYPIRQMWPTPHASCATGAGTAGRDGGMNIQSAVAMWPTPQSHPRTHSPRKVHPVKGGVQLANLAGGSLNPDWVTWLMGYPEGWLDISTPNPQSPESLKESRNAPQS